MASWTCFRKVQSETAGIYLHFMFFFLSCIFVMASFISLHFGLSVLFFLHWDHIFFTVISLLYQINLSCSKSKTIDGMLHHQTLLRLSILAEFWITISFTFYHCFLNGYFLVSFILTFFPNYSREFYLLYIIM